MIITCEACGTSFKIKSSLIKETGSTVRCSKCRHLFIAYPPTMETEKFSEFLPDEKIESTIDMTFEEDIDEEMVSKAFEDEDEAGEQLSLRDKETKGEILGEKASQGLFDETEALFDKLEREAEEPEVIMSDLEVEDDGIINLYDLERKTESPEEVDLSDLSQEDAEESDLVSLEDLEHEAEDKSEIIDFDDLETEYSPEDETVIMDTPVAEGEKEPLSLDELEEEADDEQVEDAAEAE